MNQNTDIELKERRNEEMEIDLIELFGHFMSRIWWIVGAFIIGALIAGLLTAFVITPKYTATAKMYMVNSSSQSVVDLTDFNIGQSLSDDYVELLKTRPIVESVIQEQNLREIEYLKAAKRETGMPIAKEILSVEDIPKYEDVDILFVGQRNMTNYPLLAELGEMRKPIILKRSVSATLEELLMAAEYVMAGGNKDIILCERGIRTFSDYTKTTLDIAAIPLLKELSHLPVIADASRSTGLGRLAAPISRAICAAGADGLIIDVHNDPAHAASNSIQAVSDEGFESIIEDILRIREVISK